MGLLVVLGGELYRWLTAGRLLAALRLLVLASACLLLPAPAAGAFLYWANRNDYSIGRANLDGSAPSGDFVSLFSSAGLPCGVAVDAGYVYWTNAVFPNTIGRASIDGVGKVDPSFIEGVSYPCGIAVYRHYLYWANGTEYGSIGRANLAGPLDVQENFVPNEQSSGGSDLNQPCGLAVNATGIYWSDDANDVIGHANLDGSGERTLLSSPGPGCGVALGGDYLYWSANTESSPGTDTIGRALISGADADPTFITGLSDPCGLAVYSNYLFFSDDPTIDRTDLDSADPTVSTEQIVSGDNNGCGVATDSLYAGHLTVGSRRSGGHGIVTLRLIVSNPGSIAAGQVGGRVKLLQPRHTITRRAGEIDLTLYPTKAAIQLLRSRSSLTARVKITYTPQGGVPATATSVVTVTAR